MKMKIKLLTDTAKIPTRGSDSAAGYDIYADINNIRIIMPHTTAKISTGIAIELPEHTFGGLFARSGLASKRGLRLANCVGIIDADFRGEIGVPLHNDTDNIKTISPGERIAQLVVIPYETIEFEKVDELTTTKRGDSGFGDSGRF